MNLTAIAKYTSRGIEKRRDAIVPGGTPLALSTFKVSSTEIDLSGENVVEDLPNSWIEKPITSYRIIGIDRIEFRLYIPSEEATNEARSFALYLDDGTPLIVGTPPNFYNANIAQEFLVQVEFVQNDAGEFSFVNIEFDFKELTQVEVDALWGGADAISNDEITEVVGTEPTQEESDQAYEDA